VLVVTGTGLVLLVIAPVNSEIFPTTLLEKFCTPVTIDPAKADPGKVGMVNPPPLGLLLGTWGVPLGIEPS
jgi:hypothetical protein